MTHRNHQFNLTATLDLSKLTQLDELSDTDLAEFSDDQLTPKRRQSQQESLLNLTATLSEIHLPKIRELCAKEMKEEAENEDDDEEGEEEDYEDMITASTESLNSSGSSSNMSTASSSSKRKGGRKDSGLLQPGFALGNSTDHAEAKKTNVSPPTKKKTKKSKIPTREKSPSKKKPRTPRRRRPPKRKPTAKEKALYAKVDEIRSIIDTNDEFWKKRVESLERINEIATTGRIYGLPRSLYRKMMTKLKFALCTQLCDLRSGVFKAACATLGILARTMRESGLDFSPFLEATCPILFQHHYVTIYVMRMSSIECMNELCNVCERKKLIHVLCKHSSETHKEVRAQISNYIYKLLHDRSDDNRKLDAETIELIRQVIEHNINDKDATVRKNTRELKDELNKLDGVDE